MVRDSFDILELSRNRGEDGDVTLLREAPAVMANGLMAAETSVKMSHLGLKNYEMGFTVRGVP